MKTSDGTAAVASPEHRRTLPATVVYAHPGGTFAVDVELPAGSTLADAVRVSGLLQGEGGGRGAALDIGVFGKVLPANTPLRAGDRVEIYRALTVDPKEARRLRAEVKRRRAAR